jgi:hypothetical protein
VTRRAAIGALLALSLAAAPGPIASGEGRERALEEIPELMGRILDSQQEIRAREAELAPIVAGHDAELEAAKRGIEDAAGEADAVEALLGYVEAYAARLDAQEEGLRSMAGPVARMRADARELLRAAERTSAPGAGAAAHPDLLADHFEGVAAATSALAARLGREAEAASAGEVLHATWASRGAAALPLPELRPDGAQAFARRAEALTARYQARAAQLRSERRALRGLLDLLIQRQLGSRLDALFAEGDGAGEEALLAGDQRSPSWRDLENAVARAFDLSEGSDGGLGAGPGSLDRLDRFARGAHRE